MLAHFFSTSRRLMHIWATVEERERERFAHTVCSSSSKNRQESRWAIHRHSRQNGSKIENEHWKKFPLFVLVIDVVVLQYISLSDFFSSSLSLSLSHSTSFFSLVQSCMYRVISFLWLYFPWSYHHIDIYHAERRYFILYTFGFWRVAVCCCFASISTFSNGTSKFHYERVIELMESNNGMHPQAILNRRKQFNKTIFQCGERQRQNEIERERVSVGKMKWSSAKQQIVRLISVSIQVMSI